MSIREVRSNSKGLTRRAVTTAMLIVPASLGAASTGAVAQAARGAQFPNQALFVASQKCGKVGEVCLKHCVRLTRAGDKSLADCMRTVRDMLPVVAATGRLAVLNSRHLKEMAKVCADVCAACEVECRKHEFHHKECAACAAACAEMVAECKKVLGA